MLVGAACLSHTPLMDRARANPQSEAQFFEAVGTLKRGIEDNGADVAVVFFPDHFNGFFYKLLPAFCVGLKASSIGDFSTIPGPLAVPMELAGDCAAFCLSEGVDVAISHDMQVDHGCAQAAELLGLSRLIPIFVNCAAPPLPRFARARALGQAVGRWARTRSERIVTVGSGGLSHDPPLPKLNDATRTQLVEGAPLSHAARMSRQARVFATGEAFVAGKAAIRALNPDWDQSALDRLVRGDLGFLDATVDHELTECAGCGAHELRTWIAALAALQPFDVKHKFYTPVPEWITGVGALWAQPAANGGDPV